MEIYLPIAELPVPVFLVLAMAAAVGFVSGLFGVGGGFLMTPLLIFIGIPPAIAVASVSAQIAASSMTGALSYWRRRAVDLQLGLLLIVFGFLGTVAGVLFFNQMRRIGQLDLVIVLSYVVLFTVIGALMLIDSMRRIVRARQRAGLPAQTKRRERPWYFGLPLRMRFPTSKLYMSILPVGLCAFLIGFAGAVLGIGGGFIMVPALLYLFHVPTAVVIGTSLFQILATMTAATILHAVTNHSVDMLLAIMLIVGGVFGAQFGTRAGQKLRGETFRLLLALLVLSVGLRFLVELVVRPQEPFSIAVMERAR